MGQNGQETKTTAVHEAAPQVGDEVIELLRSDARKERVARRGIELLEGVAVAM